MRNLVLIIFLSSVFLFSGLFIVDEREVAVIINNKDVTSYSSGIHWKIPFVGNITYVYKNIRNSYFSLSESLPIAGNKQVDSKFMFTWTIVDPVQYVKYLHANPNKKFDAAIVTQLNDKIITQSSNSTSLIDFTDNVAKLNNIVFNSLGVKVLSLSIINLEIESSNLQLESNTSNQSPESAYLYAMKVKSQADLTQQQQLQKLKNTNQSFYEFFMKINSLQSSAKSKSDVPTLDKLVSD